MVHQTSPIIQACPAIILGKLRGVPVYTWVLDIWPDAMSSGGGIKNKHMLYWMDKLVRMVYNNSTKILISSSDFETLILKQGNCKDKLMYFPNWSEDILSMPIINIPELPAGFRIMMAGNLGKAQTITAVMQAVLEMKNNEEVKWIFVGDGSERKYIELFRKEYHLENTVYVLGRYSFEYMPAFFRQANAMLITLRAKFPHLRAVVPARLQSYMSAGKPILGMIEGGSANLIKKARCGYIVPAEDYKAFCELITRKVLPNRDEFSKLGENGRKYFTEYFTKKTCIDHLEEIINNG